VVTASFQTILFDLDDTLLQDVAISNAAMKKLFEEAAAQEIFAPEVSLEELANKTITLAHKKWSEGPCYQLCRSIGICAFECLWGHFDTPGKPWEELRAWALPYREAVFTEIVRQEGLQEKFLASDQQTLGAYLASSFMKYRRELEQLMPGAKELLERLHPHYRLGLVTNGAPDLQREKLAASRLEPFFDVVMISGEYGKGKPDPAIFWEALQCLEATPEKSIMVGNSLQRDIAGAEAAGIFSVWLRVEGAEEHDQVTPRHTIHRLEELLAILWT
jgi:putative hydrolase of the HAD superfamily